MSKEVENIERLMENKQAEFRDFKLTNIETRKTEDNKEELVLEGIPCVFNTETVLYDTDDWELRETIEREAFNESNMTDVIFNYNHGGRVYARTRNNSLNLSTEPDGLHMRASLMPEDEGHQQLARDIKSGLIDKMSFAFTVKECEYTSRQSKGEKDIDLRTIKKIDRLFDVSAVDIPAYDTTVISARRAFEAESEKRNLLKAKAESKARALYEYTKLKEGK